ncbi:hypothetical protein ACP70R_010483 [Stipagrostis hirtigluma subsp. patula]
MTSHGKVIRVTFCTAPPPLVSYVCVWSPDANIGMEPTIEAAEDDLLLLRVPIRDPPKRSEYFVYKATGDEGPSLRLLERLIPSLPERHNFTVYGPPMVGDDQYYIAALNLRSILHPGKFELLHFNSEDQTWRFSRFSLDGIILHLTSKVISLGGQGGVLAFADTWRGVVVCDVHGCKSPRYLPLPPQLIRFDMLRDTDDWNGRLLQYTAMNTCHSFSSSDGSDRWHDNISPTSIIGII